MHTNRARVLLADVRAATIHGWRALLEPQFEVVGAVADGQSLVEAAARLKPDVVIAGIEMPTLDGLAAAETIRRHQPQTRIVLTTLKADRAMLRKSFAAGASAYLLQTRVREDLVNAVTAALGGELTISPFEDEPEASGD